MEIPRIWEKAPVVAGVKFILSIFWVKKKTLNLQGLIKETLSKTGPAMARPARSSATALKQTGIDKDSFVHATLLQRCFHKQ